MWYLLAALSVTTIDIWATEIIWPSERHDCAMVSELGFALRLMRSRPGRDNCAEALIPHRITALGKLLTLNCLGGDCPSYTLNCLGGDCLSFTFILTIINEWLRMCQLAIINEYYYYYYPSHTVNGTHFKNCHSHFASWVNEIFPMRLNC